MPTVIAGFSSNDRVPGAVGEVLYGTSGQSAAAAPLFVLLVGLLASGANLTPDTEVRQVFSKADVDAAAGVGGELATMGYAAIDTGGNDGPPIFLAAPTAAGGAAASTGQILFAGTWTNVGQFTIRINGKPIIVTVGNTDTPTLVATNTALAINGAYNARLPILASASGAKVTLTWRTASIRGNQAVVFLDSSQAPSGCTGSLCGTIWTTVQVVATGNFAYPATPNGFYFKATTGGTNDASEPTWPTTIGGTVVDGTTTWTCWGKIVAGVGANGNTSGVTLGGGAGTEAYTNLLATLLNSCYARIGVAANDATSMAAWKAQIDNQAAAPVNILQHVVVCQNSTMTAGTTLAQTTLNDQRFQVLWCLNGEGFPAETSARMATLRASSESADPDAAYNFAPIPGAPPMTQKADIPSHSVLVAALNNGLTPLTTTHNDGVLRCVRSVTSHTLIGSSPDYSTSDTGEASTPDFVLQDLKLEWATFAANNPRVQDNPLPGEHIPPVGVAYPDLWASTVESKMIDYSQGIISDGSSASVEPLCEAPRDGDIVANFDPIAERIMLAVNVRVEPNNAQVGISVRQAAA